MRVLIIEDEENVVELLRVNMSRRGYTVSIARDGKSGLEMAFTLKPEAILLNVRLPDIDGWEVCRRIKQNPLTGDAFVVFVTAAAQKGQIEKAREAGSDYFMAKPFDINKLLEVLNGIMSR
ncbi:MAG: response regulator transcription factor [Chitinivibrionales bacterium]